MEAKRGRGRPRKGEEGRFERLDIRLTPQEKALIQSKAKEQGLTITEIILIGLGIAVTTVIIKDIIDGE